MAEAENKESKVEEAKIESAPEQKEPTQSAPAQSKSSNSGMKIVIIVIVVLVVIGVIGSLVAGWAIKKFSENAAESIISAGTGADVDINSKDGSVNAESEDGSLSLGGKIWPKDMPSDVPEFKDGKIAAVSAVKSGEGQSWSVDVSEVTKAEYDAYKNALTSAGFTESSSFSSETEVVGYENTSWDINLLYEESAKSLMITVSKKSSV